MLESLNEMKFIIVALNLIILYIILRKILFKPVTEFMENRTKSIADSIEAAKKQKAEAFEMKRSYEEQLKGARAEGERLLEEARIRGDNEYNKHVNEAQQEAEAILARARDEVENEREQMLKGIRSQVAGLALAAATRVIEANMNTESNMVLVDKFINETFQHRPESTLRTKKRTSSGIFAGKAQEDLLHFLLMQVDKERVDSSPGNCREYVIMAKERNKVHNITIFTASPIDQAKIDSISEKFRVLHNVNSAKTVLEIDPSLIGGIKVAIDDKLYDGTIKGRLEKLHETLIRQ